MKGCGAYQSESRARSTEVLALDNYDWSYRGGFKKCHWGGTGTNDAYMLLFMSENMLVLAE